MGCLLTRFTEVWQRTLVIPSVSIIVVVEGEVGVQTLIKFSKYLPETKFYFFGGEVVANTVSYHAEEAFNVI